VVGLFVSTWVAGSAHAGLVGIGQTRSVDDRANITGDGPHLASDSTNLPGSYIQSFSLTATNGGNSVTANSGQNSFVPDTTGNSFGGSGYANFSSAISTPGISGDVYPGAGLNPIVDSGLQVVFSLTTPHVYEFSGNLSGSISPDAGLFAYSIATLIEEDPTGSYLNVFENTSFDVTGLLNPGTYTVIVAGVTGDESPLTGNQFGTTAWDFNFKVSSVPEPGSLALFSIGLVTIVGFCWLKQRKAKAVAV
jgi:hypothetical protein